LPPSDAGGSGRAETSATSLAELARLFLRLGVISFGGPAAHIALMEDEIVRRRRWLTREEFLDLLGAANLIPGPNSTELAIHIGRVRAGWAGLFVAGTCFIAPAALIVLGIAWAYVRFGALPAAARVMAAVAPVVIAVVIQAIVGLARTALRSRELVVVGVAAVAAALAGVHELVILLVAGGVMAISRARIGAHDGSKAATFVLTFAGGESLAGAAGVGAVALTPLFLVFLKIGAVLFGSGYVLLAFLRADLVVRLGWLTERQLLDAVAVGQVTPGPVFTTATFVGYVLGGVGGAAVATLGIFLPAFLFVAASGPLLPRVRRSPVARAALDGVNVASLALMVVVTGELARNALTAPVAIAVAVASAVALLRWRVNVAWLVLGGALVGLLVR
jgi:chromate transporter